MDTNRISTLKKFEEHKGEHVLCNYRVFRFIGILEDDMDYCYVLYDGRKVHFHTILDRLTVLKGKIDQGHYDEMVRLAKINHEDQPDIWMITTKNDGVTPETVLTLNREAKADITEQCMETPNKLMADLCWDLN